MSTRVAQGDRIPLDATFTVGGQLVDPTTPLVDILNPSSVQVVTDAVPVRRSLGTYDYPDGGYLVAVDAPLGVWTVHWTGTLNGSPVSADDYFEVVLPGDIGFSGTPYAALAELKSGMGITDTTDDSLLQVALDAATTLIDQHCNRTFVAAAAPTTRYFTATSRDRVEVDDIYSTSGLVVTSNNVAVPAAVPYVSAGYELGPVNAPSLGRPWTYLRHTGGSWWSAAAWPGFYSAEGAIAVTARWGFAATVPTAIKQACLLQANRIFARKGSPFGVAGSPDVGSEVRLLARVDPDVAVLLRPFVRCWAG